MILSLSGKALRTYVDIARLAEIQRILGESILILSLPCKALRMFVESQGLPSDSTCVHKAEPVKLDIKKTPHIMFISLPSQV